MYLLLSASLWSHNYLYSLSHLCCWFETVKCFMKAVFKVPLHFSRFCHDIFLNWKSGHNTFLSIISLNPFHGFQNEVLTPCFSKQRLVCLLLPLPCGVLAPIIPMTLPLPLCLGPTAAIFLWKLSFRAGDIAQWLRELSTHTEAWGLVPKIHIVAHSSCACHSSSRASDALFWPPHLPASTWDT